MILHSKKCPTLRVSDSHTAVADNDINSRIHIVSQGYV